MRFGRRYRWCLSREQARERSREKAEPENFHAYYYARIACGY
jgi:hypothetical protein